MPFLYCLITVRRNQLQYRVILKECQFSSAQPEEDPNRPLFLTWAGFHKITIPSFGNLWAKKGVTLLFQIRDVRRGGSHQLQGDRLQEFPGQPQVPGHWKKYGEGSKQKGPCSQELKSSPTPHTDVCLEASRLQKPQGLWEHLLRHLGVLAVWAMLSS